MNFCINYKNIPPDAFIIKCKNVIKYVPEIEIKIKLFDADKWKSRFPFYPNVDYKQLKLTNIGSYSIASPENSKNLIILLNEINSRYKFADNLQDLVITEAAGGIGGFSIRLAKTFKKINIVEITKLHSDLLKHNLNIYHLTSADIKVYNVDYLDILYSLYQDVIIFDLPWDGPIYKLAHHLSLGLNNINIWYIINELHKLNKFKFCVIMAPKNFDLQNFIANIISPDIFIKKINKHYFIVILNIL